LIGSKQVGTSSVRPTRGQKGGRNVTIGSE
jgi:hypothetical protein